MPELMKRPGLRAPNGRASFDALFFAILLVTVTLMAVPAGISAQERDEKVSGKPDRVTLTLKWLTQSQFAGYYAALENGFYREEGINLTIKPGAPDIEPVSLVASGVSDFGIQWLADFITSSSKGLQLVSVAQILQSNGLVLMSWADAGIKKPEDLSGKKAGVWFFGNEVQFYTLMRKYHIPLNSINISPLRSSIRPFIERNYDVISAMIYNEYITVLEQGFAGDSINIIDFADYGLDFPGDVMFTRQELLKNNPGLCVRMVRASLRGWQWAMENQEKAVDIVIRHDLSGTLERNHELAQLREVIKLIRKGNIPLGYHSPEKTGFVVSKLFENRMIQREFDPALFYTNEVWEKAKPGGK